MKGKGVPDEGKLYFSSTEAELPPCQIFIDREGDWYHRGARMQREDIVAHLCQHVRREESSGRYIIEMDKQRCFLEVEDTPLVINQVVQRPEEDEKRPEHLVLVIKHIEENELLDPTTLWVGKDNVLYCTVRRDTLPARFLRPAYYQLARFISEDSENESFYLVLARGRYHIQQKTETE
jgi:hypothetical protein